MMTIEEIMSADLEAISDEHGAAGLPTEGWRGWDLDEARDILIDHNRVFANGNYGLTDYYAVCDVHGPISRAIKAVDLEHATRLIERHGREWIDAAESDAEDDMDIEGGDSMDHEAFSEALTAAGCVVLVGDGSLRPIPGWRPNQ